MVSCAAIGCGGWPCAGVPSHRSSPEPERGTPLPIFRHASSSSTTSAATCGQRASQMGRKACERPDDCGGSHSPSDA